MFIFGLPGGLYYGTEDDVRVASDRIVVGKSKAFTMEDTEGNGLRPGTTMQA
jgi:hypothetical protein